MPYVSSGGQLQGSRSPWRASILYDTFWSLIDFVVLFFRTMFQPDLTKRGNESRSNYSSRPQGGPGFPGSRRNMGGFRRSTGPAAPPLAGGG
ncbi:unnamed protein product [Clavelina lepadiformis]|uniref:Selenoprotein K n=1 Tax=Clavelina lepadiformis TaxID=159417 RepID=A0ABP0GFF6_CLALP